jgi:hypothetical protein
MPHWPELLQLAVPLEAGPGQETHCAPPVPHAVADSGSHVSLPLAAPASLTGAPASRAPPQQPVGQVRALHEHVPFVVSHRPLEQVVQRAPPWPHAPGVCAAYITQAPVVVQQPSGQLVVVHGGAASPCCEASPPSEASPCCEASPCSDASPPAVESGLPVLPSLDVESGPAPPSSKAGRSWPPRRAPQPDRIRPTVRIPRGPFARVMLRTHLG